MDEQQFCTLTAINGTTTLCRRGPTCYLVIWVEMGWIPAALLAPDIHDDLALRLYSLSPERAGDA